MTYYELISLIAAIVGIISFTWLVYEKKFPLKKISWKKVQKGSEHICQEMVNNAFKPTLIFGIGRGGSILGSLISGHLGHCPQLVVDRKYVWSDKGRKEDFIFRVDIPKKYLSNVLLVAGEAHSGRTMDLYYDYFKSMNAGQIKRAVFLFEKGCPTHVEFKGMETSRKELRLPWMFSKNYIRSNMECGPKNNCKTEIKLHIIRHAETTAGEDVFLGKTDYPLSIKGLEQSLNSGSLFAHKKIIKVYSSPCERAIKTAKIIQHFIPGSDLIIDELLREIDFGKWDGLPRKEIKKLYSNDYEKWEEDPSKNIPEGAESIENVSERCYQFLEKLEKTNSAKNEIEIIMVSHKTTIRVLLSMIEFMRLSEYRNINVPNCSVHTLSFSCKKWEINNGIDISHKSE